MFTTKNPNHCPKCNCTEICLGDRVLKKDIEGNDTDIVILGA